MLTRILTALPIIAAFLLAIYFAPPDVWLGFIALVLFLGGMEWGKLARLGKAASLIYASVLTGAGVALALFPADDTWVYLASLALWLTVPWLLWRGVALNTLPVMLPLGALILVPTFLAIVQLRAHDPNLVTALIGLTGIADSAAYFAGRRFGRRKLAPGISPGKTWEGVAGAWVAVSLYTLLLTLIWPLLASFSAPLLVLLVWALLVLSVLGDLLESWIKRLAGVKDSGNLLPGHGGVLDRIDSLTAVMPAAALLWMWGT